MWVVPWQGTEIDLDPLDMDMELWAEIERRAGISSIAELLQEMGSLKPTAWKALYWAGAEKAGLNPGPFSDFRGPTYREFMSQRAGMNAFLEEFDALMSEPGPKEPAPGGAGSADSPPI